MLRNLLKTILLIACIAPSLAQADKGVLDKLNLKVGALLDLRAIRTDEARSWLDDGLGKTRYGGNELSSDEFLRISQASLWVTAKPLQDVVFHTRVNIDAEHSRTPRGERVDLIESFLVYRPFLSTKTRLKLKGGVFFPPISLENEKQAWTSKYSLTPSAINSWIADEVRTIGIEGSLTYTNLSRELKVLGALFQFNDPAGSLLAWRGWAMGNRQSGIADIVPIADIPSFAEGAIFSEGDRDVRPFVELDDRVGGYFGLKISDFRYLELQGLYYDNNGNTSVFDGSQYAWHTTFVSLGARAPIGDNFELVGQFMDGGARMGRPLCPRGQLCTDNDFRAYYILASAFYKEHRLSLRYDNFEVEDKDILQARDDNRDDGYAWTLAYFYKLDRNHRFGAELLSIKSDHPNREQIGLSAVERETLAQLSYRFLY